MSLEAIKIIKKSEKQAEEIIANAKKEAMAIIEKVKLEAKTKADESLEKFGLEMDEIIKKTGSEAQMQASQIMQDIENQCKSLKETAGQKMSMAIDIVTKEIKGISRV